LAAFLADLLASQIELNQLPAHGSADTTLDSQGGLLDELFDSVESAAAVGESGIQ
jgi:hypothetical protein